ncbi:HAD family hydrolase [Aurantiacibacter flavus]|uniref:HAD family hydrolase n=1 Tax=Aurantiacibacter flavus TaxID=3145232 RepID=A0ABV0CYS0_9SPHN
MIEIAAQVVVLDLDDTLYLERDFAESGFRALARRFGERIGGEAFVAACCERLAGGARGNIFDIALTRNGIDPAPGLIAELVAYYRSHAPEIALCADASRFLRRVGQFQTGLITDGPQEAQSAKIKALGLDRALGHVIMTGVWGKQYSKPHARAFELIESLTSSSRHNIVYIADNGAKDFIAPRQLGWQSVQILRPERIHDGLPGETAHEADHVITSLDELDIKIA